MFWIWLTTIPYVGPVMRNRLIQYFKTPELIYYADSVELSKVEGIRKKQVCSILENHSLKRAYEILQRCEDDDIQMMTIMDAIYPDRAIIDEKSPILLYYKGIVREMASTVGIVGARRCTQNNKQSVIMLTEEYVSRGFTIISGMAKGIDSYAHTACINAGGYTVAILGNGLDICYPSEHIKLMKSIAERGLLVSEYPPGTKPVQYHFPQRNRLISAWSDQLVVLAAGERSGALITADFSREYGREVDIIIPQFDDR